MSLRHPVFASWCITVAVCGRVLWCVAVCCSVLHCVAVCCSALQCVAVCCSVLQCVAVCCSVLQCVAVGGETCTTRVKRLMLYNTSRSQFCVVSFWTHFFSNILSSLLQLCVIPFALYDTSLSQLDDTSCKVVKVSPHHCFTHIPHIPRIPHMTHITHITHCNTLQRTATHCNTLQRTTHSTHETHYTHSAHYTYSTHSFYETFTTSRHLKVSPPPLFTTLRPTAFKPTSYDAWHMTRVFHKCWSYFFKFSVVYFYFFPMFLVLFAISFLTSLHEFFTTLRHEYFFVSLLFCFFLVPTCRKTRIWILLPLSSVPLRFM